eukprot:766326-Hanusia_phi.AAC.3
MELTQARLCKCKPDHLRLETAWWCILLHDSESPKHRFDRSAKTCTLEEFFSRRVRFRRTALEMARNPVPPPPEAVTVELSEQPAVPTSNIETDVMLPVC